RRLLQWLRGWPLQREREDLVDRAVELGKRIREFRIPGYVVRDANEATLRRIFKRVNTSGVSMTESEVFDAIHGQGDHRPAEDASRRLSELGFGSFESKWFVAAL